jgi:imidazolonepropionase-like amidohydrolase
LSVLILVAPSWAEDALEQAEARGLASLDEVASVEAPSVVLANASVMTAAGHVYAKGYVVLDHGEILSVGEGAAPDVEGATVLDLRGRFVTPGLIDTHSHLGVYPSPSAKAHGDGNEATSPTTAGVWAEHSLWPQDPGLARAIAGGITAMQVLPGSANLIGGRGVVVQMVPARGSRGMRFPGAPETVKMACGENPKRVYGAHRNSAPSTRMGNLRGQRTAFLEAESYKRKWDEYQDEIGDSELGEGVTKKKKKKGGDAEPVKPPDRDLNLETLVGVLEGRVLPQIHCYRADDMLSMLQVADEFGWQVRSFHHALEAWKIRDVLAHHEVASSTWADWWGFKLEAYDGIQENAALLEQAGAKAIIHSDSGIGIQRLNQEASKAMAAGQRAGIELTEDQVLRWITLNPAWALGIDEQTGSLEVGKRADVVVWDAHPFSVYASAELVFVQGALRWDKERPAAWSDFQIGQEVAP